MTSMAWRPVTQRQAHTQGLSLEHDMSDSLFLTDEELAQLTGRKIKSLQIKWLRTSGLPFWVNARGHPVVTRAAVHGLPVTKAPRDAWVPNFLKQGQ